MEENSKAISEFASQLNEEDLRLLNNALNEIINGPSSIKEDQFHTRTGSELHYAEDLLDKIGETLQNHSKEIGEKFT